MNYPYFTDKDLLLVQVGEGRDPLGLQPVWSSFGRELVPNLATPVMQVNGVKAVLLIYWLVEGPLAGFLQERKSPQIFRQYFRLMEGLLEYFLWESKGKLNGHCYGTRALNAEGKKFQVTTKDGRTAVNGLYQYYRGSCRRADLLFPDWKISKAASDVLESCWDDSASESLRGVLKKPLDEQGVALVPALAFTGGKLWPTLEKVFNSPAIARLLKEQLLGKECHREFARRCAEQVAREGTVQSDVDQGWVKQSVEDLLTSLHEDPGAVGELRGALENVERCEPFLLSVQDVFDLMRASPGATLSKLAQELRELFPLVRDRAADFGFLSQEVAGHSMRMKEILDLAHAALAGPREFLETVIQHHQHCMQHRGATNLLTVEGEKLVPVANADRPRQATLTRLKQGFPWYNGYYLWTAGTIYNQLFGDIAHE